MATRLQVLIEGDATGAKRALDDAGDSVEQTRSKLDRFNDGMRNAALPAAGVVAGLVGVGNAAADSASELEQSAGAVESVFKTYAGEVKAHADDAAQNVGLAESEYSQLASVLGAQLGNMGVSQGELAGQTDQLISTGADLAAQFGGSTSEAVEALSSLMRGERDPIEKYGVSISAAAVEAQKAKMGLSGLTGEADKSANTQATLALLAQQTASAHGAFAREAGTAAGAQQRANAEMTNASAQLGAVLLPVIAQGSQMLADFTRFVSDNSGAFTILAGVVGGIAVGILAYNAATSAAQVVTGAATAAQWLWNTALSANPLALIVLAIGAVVGAIALLVKNWDWVKETALGVWNAISDAVDQAAQWLEDTWNGAVQAVGGFFTDLGTGIQETVQGVVDWFQTTWDSAVQAVGGFFTGLGQSISGTFQGIIDWFADIPNKIAGFFGSIQLPQWLSDIASWFGLSREFAAAGPPAITASTVSTTTLVPSLASTSTAGPGINITVEGALDPRAVARQIMGLIDAELKAAGRIPVNGTAFA